jgi:hypothetical protein
MVDLISGADATYKFIKLTGDFAKAMTSQDGLGARDTLIDLAKLAGAVRNVFLFTPDEATREDARLAGAEILEVLYKAADVAHDILPPGSVEDIAQLMDQQFLEQPQSLGVPLIIALGLGPMEEGCGKCPACKLRAELEMQAASTLN